MIHGFQQKYEVRVTLKQLHLHIVVAIETADLSEILVCKCTVPMHDMQTYNRLGLSSFREQKNFCQYVHISAVDQAENHKSSSLVVSPASNYMFSKSSNGSNIITGHIAIKSFIVGKSHVVRKCLRYL